MRMGKVCGNKCGTAQNGWFLQPSFQLEHCCEGQQRNDAISIVREFTLQSAVVPSSLRPPQYHNNRQKQSGIHHSEGGESLEKGEE